MNSLEERVAEVLKDLKSILENDYIKQEYECEIKVAINLIYELEGIRYIEGKSKKEC